MKTHKRKQRLIHPIVSAMMIAALFIGLIPTALAADKLPFSDVPSTHTYYDDICWAVENGIVIGCNGKFYPDEKVSLVQFYTMLSRSIPEDENDTGSLGAEKGSMIYHLRRAVRHGWTGRNGAEIELQKDSEIMAGRAWNYALTATGTKVYTRRLYGQSPDTCKEGMNAAKSLGLAPDNANAAELITRAQAVAIIHAAHSNTKALSEPPIVAEMKGVVKSLPQGVFNDFYADMMAVPEQIRKAFVADGWTISFDTEKINAYSSETGIHGIGGLTDYSSKQILLANEGSFLHEMGHYYQQKLYASGMDKNVYTAFNDIRAQEKWTGSLFASGSQNTGEEFFADAFAYYVKTGVVRAKDTDAGLKSQSYFDSLAARDWIY